MNQVRIIGGKWRRRQLAFTDRSGLRPTPDRLRETLFNWLMFDLPNYQLVVDLCAGSGALGFEAVSRGAANAILVEPDRTQQRLLAASREQLAAQEVTLLAMTAERAYHQITGPIDLLFLDPPYALSLWESLSYLYDDKLNANALIYVEADRSLDTIRLPHRWQLHRDTRVGAIYAGLFRTQDQTPKMIEAES